MNGGTIYGSNDPTLKNTANNEGAAVYIKHSSEGIENTIHSYPQ
jgi:hypothetical protein